MPYDEEEESQVSQMRQAGVPKEFSRWTISYLSGSGYDYQSVDVQSHYDNSLTFQENKAMFKQMYPSKPGEKYAKGMTHAQMNKAQYDTYASNVQMTQEAKEAERLKKKEFAEAEIERSTKVRKSGEDALPSDELTEAVEEEQKNRGFLEKVGSFLDERKAHKKKGEEIKTTQTQKELQQKLELAKAKRDIRMAEREVTREDIEQKKYQMMGGATGEMLLSGMDFLGKRGPEQPQRERQFLNKPQSDSQSSMRKDLDVTVRESPRATGQPARTSLRQELDILARPAQGQQQKDRFGLDIFQSKQAQQPKQKYKYRMVIEKGVARRERIPIPQDPNAPQQMQQQSPQNSFIASMDIFNTPRRMNGRQNGNQLGRTSGPALDRFSLTGRRDLGLQGNKRDFSISKKPWGTPKAKSKLTVGKPKKIQFFSRPKKGKAKSKRRTKRFF